MSSYPPAVKLEPGLRLDRYELLCVLAHGGMGSVWLARLEGKHGFERLVALKTVLPQHAVDDRYRRMFLDEARLASRIAHPNVAQTLDLGESHGVLYFVMEWVDGDSLRKLRNAVKKVGDEFPISIALRICADACAGMHTAHELRGDDGEPLGVVHRDVSPHNILVSVTGITKVIDFGIAKARERLAEETHTDELKGKVDYMAPEQAVGPTIDRRTDVWSLGAVLYFLCAGYAPFEAETKVASLMQRIEGRPPAPLPPNVPGVVQEIVMKALSRDPARRFHDAAEMQRALEEAMGTTGEIATAAEVSAFIREHLAESIAHRRAAVQAALDAASERHRKNVQLEEPLEGRRIGTVVDPEEALPTTKRAAPKIGADSTGSSKPFVVSAKDVPSSAAPPQMAAAGVPKRGQLRVVAFGASAAFLVAILLFVARARIVGASSVHPTSAVAPTASEEAPAPAPVPDPDPTTPIAATSATPAPAATSIELDTPRRAKPPSRPPRAAPPPPPPKRTPPPQPPPKRPDPNPKVQDDGF